MSEDSDTNADAPTQPASQISSEFGVADLMNPGVGGETLRSTPASPRVRLGPGEVLADRFRLEQRIGEGGMGSVWRATHLSLKTPVAVKLIDPRLVDTPEARRRFAQEARAAASLRGTNVVQVFDHGVHEGVPYIVMELLEGESLGQRLAARGKLSFTEALPLLADVCRAIARAHDLGLIHRDLKPGNIFLCTDEERERAKVLDFGVAKATEGEMAVDADTTRVGAVVGTPYYMSPEQLRASAAIDHRSDLWSIGVVAYECLTGSRPFLGRSIAELAVQISAGCTPAASRRAPVPRGFDAWIDRALRVEPDDRFGSARTMLAALEDLALAGPSEAVGAGDETASGLDELLSGAETQLESLRVAARGGHLDGELARLSEFLTSSSRAVEHLAEPGAHEDEGFTAYVAMLRGMALELDELLTTQASDDWLGYRSRLHGSVHAPLARLLERETSGSLVVSGDAFLLLDDEELEVGRDELDRDWATALLSDDELERHEALLALVGPERDAFLAFLGASEAPERDRVLWRLWDASELLLLEGRSRTFKVFEAARRLASFEGLGERWDWLVLLFRAPESEDDDSVGEGQGVLPSAEQVEAKLGEVLPVDREVLCRVLVLHRSPDYRALALRLAEPARLWTIIAHPKTPPGVLLEIWRAVHARVGRDFLKVFFVCVVDLLPRQRTRARMVAALELVEAFYLVDCFHEDTLFRMLTALDEVMRQAAAEHGLSLDIAGDYAQHFEAFLAGGQRRDQPVQSWISVPLPVQRRLARRGAFLRYFVTHPVAAIAMECVPHLLALREVTDFFEIRTINPKVLERLGRESRFLRRDAARLALVANPKVSARTVLRYVPTLRRDSLRKLASSRSASTAAREQARRLLDRKR